MWLFLNSVCCSGWLEPLNLLWFLIEASIVSIVFYVWLRYCLDAVQIVVELIFVSFFLPQLPLLFCKWLRWWTHIWLIFLLKVKRLVSPTSFIIKLIYLISYCSQFNILCQIIFPSSSDDISPLVVHKLCCIEWR